MSKNLSPKKAYKLVEQVAQKNNMSISAWAEKCGVSKSTVSHWLRKPNNRTSVMVSTLERLGVTI